MLDTRWELNHDQYAIGITAAEATSFQGFHSPALLVVVDEAAGVHEDIFEAVDSMATAGDPRIIYIGNPTSSSGGFHRAFHRERTLFNLHTMSAMDSPNVLAKDVVWPGLVTHKWVEERKEVWGEDSPMFTARVLGEFPTQGTDTLIPLENITAASSDDAPAPSNPNILGVDVARFGSDSSAIAIRQGQAISEIHTLYKLDTMSLSGWVVNAATQLDPPPTIFVDEIGVGAGVVDRLRELGFNVIGINVARPAQQSGMFINQRAEGYWELRRLLAENQLRLPPHLRLEAELSDIRYFFASDGRIQIESKDDMKARGSHSPDVADAVMLTVLGQHSTFQFFT